MPIPYADAFRQHARQNLDAQVYDALHRKARGTAGGTALRSPTVREVRFDGSKYTREQCVEWLRSHGYNEAGLQPDGENWLFQAHGGLPMQGETTRAMGAGIVATVGKYQPEEEGKKGMLDAVAKIFKSIISDAAAETERRGAAPRAAPVAAVVAKANIDPAYLDAARLLASQDYYADIGHGADNARSLALAMIEKNADAFDDDREAWTFGPTDIDGLDIHLGAGERRMPGHFAFELVRKEGDHGTLVHDLNLGLPLPTASARCVVVTKAMADLVDDPAALTRDIRRVLMPGGRLLTAYQEDVLKDSAGGLAYVGRSDMLREWVRITDPAEHGDIRKVLEDVPGFVVHNAGVSDSGAEALAGMPDGKQDIIRKALDPGRTLPMVTASPARQIVYCTVLEPDSFDAHGDTMTADDIEYTAHRYLTNSRVIGSGHSKAIQARPVESFIAPQDLFYESGPFGPQQVRKGSWVVGIHVEDPAEWEKVIEGQYTGVSIGGFGMREPVEKDFSPDQPRDESGRWGDGGGGGHRKPNYGQKGDDDTRSDSRHFARQRRKADKEVEHAKAAVEEAKAQHAAVAREHEAKVQTLKAQHEKAKADIEANLERRKAEIHAKYAARAAAREQARSERKAKRPPSGPA